MKLLEDIEVNTHWSLKGKKLLKKIAGKFLLRYEIDILIKGWSLCLKKSQSKYMKKVLLHRCAMKEPERENWNKITYWTCNELLINGFHARPDGQIVIAGSEWSLWNFYCCKLIFHDRYLLIRELISGPIQYTKSDLKSFFELFQLNIAVLCPNGYWRSSSFLKL